MRAPLIGFGIAFLSALSVYVTDPCQLSLKRLVSDDCIAW
jgi:hypothetical protein